MQAISEDTQYQGLLAEALKIAELQERALFITEDL